MAKNVFFSFHYQRDIWRVNQIRNLDGIVGSAAAGFRDASLWEETKKQGDAAIKRLIDQGLQNTSVTVVCIGAQTAGRKYINYEIERSIGRGNALMGLRIHHLKDMKGSQDSPGEVPAKLSAIRAPIYTYTTHHELAQWIRNLS